MKQRQAVVLRVDLRVIAARREIGAGERGELRRLARRGQLAREHAADERLRRRIRRVVDDEAAIAEHLFDPAAERVGHAEARRVGAPQPRNHRLAEFRRGEQAFDFVEGFEDGVVERDGGDRGRFSAGPRRQRDRARRQLVVEHRARADFVPVVVLRVDPEDRDGRHVVVARHLFGELEGGQRLEEREERAAEEPGLLAGDDRDRLAVGQQSAGFARARRRSAPFLLPGDDGGDVVAAAIVRLGPRDRVGPRAAVRRIAGKERRDGSKSRTRSRRRAAESTESGGRRPECARKARRESETLKARLS